MLEWRRGTAIAADGARLAYWATGDGTPLLLIAGQSVDHTSWRMAAPRLVEERTLIVFDHRGIGESQIGERERFTVRDFAADAVAILASAGFERADVLGHSMGGMVAQWVAIDHPDRVRRLVLAATSSGLSNGTGRQVEAERAVLSGRPDEIATVFWGDEHAPEQRRELAALLSVGRSRTALRLHFGASAGHDSLSELGRITAPTLVIHGADDALVPLENARILSRAIPTAHLTIVKRARHGIILDAGVGLSIADAFLRR
ncbi:MAG: alpha/beta fold hydrolase [Microbacterium sp.]